MRNILLAFLSLCQFTSTFANEDITFKHLGIKDGLSYSQVNHITKDSQGFMWFSTASGLNRYDGYSFKIFTKSIHHPYSICDNFVDHVQEDHKGRLWVHTGIAGYTYYNPQKETFHPVEPLLKEEYGIDRTPSYIYIDKEKNIWCHTDSVGTYTYNIKQKELTFYPVGEKGLYHKPISSVTEDENGILYIYEDGMIECLDRHSNQIIHRNTFLIKKSGKHSLKYTLFVDADGDYWAYTKDQTGLWAYYREEDKWEYYCTHNTSPYVLSNNIVTDIKQDTKGQI